MNKRIGLLIVGALVGIAVIFAAWGPGSGVENVDALESVRPPLPVSTLIVAATDHFTISRLYAGNVVARRATEVGFERGGKVDVISVDEGDYVKTGHVLAQLSTRKLQASRKEIEAQRLQALAKFDEMIAGPREESIRAARANVDDLGEQVAIVELRRTRAERLLAEKAVPQGAFDEAAAEEKQIRARLNAAQQQLDELLAGTREEQVRAQKGVIDQLDSALASIDVDLEECVLRAPFDGSITARHGDEGMIAAPGEPLFRIVETGALEARIGVPAELTTGLVANGEYTILVEDVTHPATLKSVVQEIDPATHTVTVVLSLPSGTTGVVAGQVARMPVEVRRDETGFWLPTTALTRGVRGLWNCYAVIETEDGLRIQERQIEVVHTENDRVYVRGTLQDGDRVIKEGVHRVAIGQLVSDVGASAPDA